MKFKINPGEFRHPIEIQRLSDKENNNDNIPITKWDTLIKAKAKILNVRGKEYLEAQGIGSEISKTFYIRASKKTIVTNEDSILYKGSRYDIEYSNDIEDKGIYLELKCKLVK